MRISLERCEHERLHLSGAIQQYGTLIATDMTGKIAYVAANAETVLGTVPEHLLGAPMLAALQDLIVALAQTPGSRQFGVIPAPGAGYLEATVIRGTHGGVVAEFVTHAQGEREDLLRSQAAPWGTAPTTEAEMAASESVIAERVADLTGFQRVMYYRFREDGDGEVIAEARRGDAYGSYLGLRFPASDIPNVARQLYLKNRWRMIPDAAALPVPILSNVDAPLDLTHSDLRSVSPVHQAYLANMNVAASLSFPISQRGKLVALIAAHHTAPTTLPWRVLERCAAHVTDHALSAASFQSTQTIRLVDEARHKLEWLRPLLQTPSAMMNNWGRVGTGLLREFHCDGARLRYGATELEAGACGGASDLLALDEWFASNGESPLIHCDSLSRQTNHRIDGQVAGALALRAKIAGKEKLCVYLTRQEYVHEVAWGGNPDKPEELEGALPIRPRRSFEKWVEMRRGYCRPWSNTESLLAFELRKMLLGTLSG